jgi:hypothetical protein
MTDDILNHNRVILCHFDTYSTALVFARYGMSVLAPAPLPDGSAPLAVPPESEAGYEPDAALAALVARFGLNPAELTLVDGFDEWLSDGDQAIRIHLAQFKTFEAPHATLAPHGGVFKPISELRGTAPVELNLLRRVFNLFMGGR